MGAPAWATGGAGRGGGALYTGRGPVCGTIMRGAGGCGGPETTEGADGRGATGGAGCGEADAATGGVAGVLTGGAGVTGRGGTTAGVAATGGATGRSGIGGGTITRGCTTGVTGAETGAGDTTGTGGFATGGATTGFATTGGATGFGGGAAAASFFCVIARSTSPGREMFDRSILVLISSSPRSGRAVFADDPCRSAEPWIWARTFSASWSSFELECVFFSVTPTSGSASRMALLLTSNSLARSLIRTLLIRPFWSPR